ncbi:MAG: hypothetical protein BGP16_00965 [Sphingobium sp. 66-54]|nr:MAG: hypothetical protein BGP16_00965 [Sphingobium sp. 66-54]
MTKKPAPLLDKNGKPVINQYGHVVSARITPEQEPVIDKMFAEGKSKRAICDELNITDRRLNTYLEEKNKPEKLAALSLTTYVATQLPVLIETVGELLTAFKELETRVCQLQTEVKMVRQAQRRNQIGREKLEREKRTTKKQLSDLRRRYWQRTGQKPL